MAARIKALVWIQQVVAQEEIFAALIQHELNHYYFMDMKHSSLEHTSTRLTIGYKY